MADFIEKAVLRVIDKSSPQIRKINSELAKLNRTAGQTKRTLAGLDLGKALNAGGARNQLARLGTSLDRVERKARETRTALSKGIVTKVSVTGIEKAISDLDRLDRKAKGVLRNIPITATGPRRTGGGGGGGGGGMRFGFGVGLPGGGGGVGASASSLKELAIASATITIGRATIEGFRERDIADTRFGLQGLTPEQIAGAQAGASAIARETPQLGRGQILGLISEFLPLTQGDVEGAVSLARETSELVALQTALGVAADEAKEGAVAYVRAGEQLGVLTDAAGKVDAKKAEAFFDTLERGAILIGEEFGPGLVQGFVKYARTAKFGLDSDALLAGFLATEESGTTAAVGLNQAIKQLTGERIQQRQLDELIRLGLIREEQIRTGTEGGADVTEIIGQGAIDEEGLRRNFNTWVREQVIPIIERERGVDFSDGLTPAETVEISKFAGSITSTTTATEALTAAIIRNNEIQAQVEQARGFDVSREGIQGVVEQSGLSQFQAVASQTTSLLGEIANSLESVFNPVLSTTASLLASLSNFVAGEEGEGSAARSGAVVGGAALLGLGAVKGGGALAKLFNPLTQSAVALDGSAAALTRAAVALGGSGVVDGGVGPTRARAQRNTVAPLGGGAVGGLLAASNVISLGSMAVRDLTADNVFWEQEKQRIEESLQKPQDDIFKEFRDSLSEFWNRPWPVGDEPAKAGQTGTLTQTAIELGFQDGQAAIENGFSDASFSIEQGFDAGAMSVENGFVSGASAAGPMLEQSLVSAADLMAERIQQAILSTPVQVAPTPAPADVGANVVGD